MVLHVADDGSRDGTVALLRDLAARRAGAVTEVRWLDVPPRRSATRSFLMLLADAVRSCPQARWFAYCDQDDVWLPRKLATAHAVLAPSDAGRPALYGGRTLAVDEEDRDGGLSPLFQRPPSFRNAVAYCTQGDVNAVRVKLVVADIGLAVAVVSLAVGLYLHGKRAF